MIEILINGQGLESVIKGQKTVAVYDLNQWEYHIPNTWLSDMQHYIGFDVGPCNDRKWTDLLKIGYWRTYTKEWKNWSLYEKTYQWCALSIYSHKKGNWGLFGEEPMGVLVLIRTNYRWYSILIIC